jgi:hypothetical protein
MSRANFEPKALEAIDRKFQAHKLLNILVEEAFREAEECLMPGGADALSSTPSPSPATRLLALLQRHFFLQAFSTDIDSRTDALVHVQDFLSRAALLLSALAAQNLPDSRAFPAWTALLQASVIGHVLPSVVVVVQLITGRGQEVSYPNTMDRPRRFNLLKRSFTSLEQIVLALDVLSASCPKSAAAETKLLSLGPLSAAPVVVETPHHCMANSEHVVSIQGATHLSLLFDPRCATESGDRLQVLNAEGAPVCPALSGDSRRESSRWPKLPIIVEGNTTTLKFVKNESSHERPSGLPPRWGFRVVISGLRCSTEGVKSESNWLKIQQHGKPLYENLSEEKIIELETPASLNKPPVPRVKPGSDLSTSWLRVLQNLTVRVLGKISRVLMDNGTANEKSVTSLDTPIFSTGKQVSHPADSDIVLQLVDLPAGSPAAALDAYMRTTFKSSPVEKLGGELAKRLVRAFIGVLLKNLGLERDAAALAEALVSPRLDRSASMEVSSEHEVVSRLHGVWIRGQNLHLWLVKSKQQAQAEYDTRLKELEQANQTPSQEFVEEGKQLGYAHLCKKLFAKADLMLRCRALCASETETAVDL